MSPNVSSKRTGKKIGKDLTENVRSQFDTILHDVILAHLKLIVAAVVVSALLIGGIIGWNVYQNSQNTKALALEAEVLKLFTEVSQKTSEAQTDPAAKSLKDVLALYQQIITQYPGTKSAEHALYLSGSVEYTQGNYDAAQQHFTAYQTKYPKGTFFAQSVVAVASIAEQQGNFQQALDILIGIETKAPAFLKPQVLLDIARNYESLNKKDVAITTYQKILDMNTSKSWKDKATERLEFLQPPQVASPETQPAATVQGIEQPQGASTPSDKQP